MARLSRVADSDESEPDSVESSNPRNSRKPTTKPNRNPVSGLAHRGEESVQDSIETNDNVDEDGDVIAMDDGDEPAEEMGDADEDADNTIVVMVPGPRNPEEYVPYQDDTVHSVLEELNSPDGETLYRVEYEDERQENVSWDFLLQINSQLSKDTVIPPYYQIVLATFTGISRLIDYFTFKNGNNALDEFNSRETSESIMVDDPSNSSRSMSSRAGKRTRRQLTDNNFVDISSIQLSSDDDRLPKNGKKKRRLVNNMSTVEIEKARRSTRAGSRQSSRPTFDDDEEDDDDHESRKSGRASTRSAAPRKANTLANYMEEEEEDELAGDLQVESEGSEIAYAKPKRRRASSARASKSEKRGRPQAYGIKSDYSSKLPKELPSRISRRGNKTGKNMEEVDIDEEIYADEVAGKAAPKVISIREIYQPVPAKAPFALVHDQDCDVCGGTGKNSNKGRSDLIYCQGCSSSIHRICLGYRAGREHMVTKVGHEHFVMQCACSSCNELGASCAAFSVKKTAKQEEKLREDNDGDDPITNVREDLVNNPDNVLFRCRGCQRGFHFEHLPPRSNKSVTSNNTEETRFKRIQEYTKDWHGMEAIRPKSYKEGGVFDDYREDEKEYLIKWEDKSYFQCSWMSGAWVWGVAAATMRKAFIRRDEGANLLPKWTSEEAISEEYLRMEIIFDVEYDKSFRPKSEEHDKAHINDVVQVLVKFRGLAYDESVWEEPPSPDEADRWSDFVSAYNEYVMGKYFKQSPANVVKERIDAFRSLNFEKQVVLKKQPASLIGGEMMKHQMEGLNWLLFNFHRQKNVILADEMGLGKTIQIVALIASLVKDKPKCSPFLVVTPKLDLSQLASRNQKMGTWPSGQMAMKYEMYPNECSDLRADIVVTSYEAPVDDSSKGFFKGVKWAGMIVDEGQRLKNDGNLLYGALTALKIPFQVLLSGTPLQNNKRELFNLLQFLDKSIDAAELDEKYADLTKENLPELHELIRPFFLRRTKLQVLKFLPPMSQTIIPVSMSSLQKQLYKSILAKNPELIKSIIGKSDRALRPTERGNLNNILMQLRKCLCHPFLYSSAIEETSLTHDALHRNLIDASSKFQLLEIMLPKLQARGHRVLIFSQFLKQLDLVEDFLNGLQLPFKRLDGTVSTLEKQKRIDAFNAPNSELFAFLLSTRAGGVGINLATADTVIIMDPDFNPHQDIQALSRAHRIGQKKKVLVFQLVTKDSAEEQIVQVGRKKMALDQALIESIDVKDDAGDNLEAILRHGAEAVLLDDNSKDIYYDPASVDELLDRSQVENTTNDDGTAESQFSHARVWIKDKGDLVEDFGDTEAEPAAPKALLWDAILKQRAADAALEAAKNMQTFGRGKRARQTVDYEKSNPDLMDLDDPEGSPQKDGRRTRKSDSDDEFGVNVARESEVESDADEAANAMELETGKSSVKGTKSKKRINARQLPNESKRKMKTQGGAKPRLQSLTLTLPSPKKPRKQDRGSKIQPDSSVMKRPDSSAVKSTAHSNKNLSVKSIRGKDTKRNGSTKPSLNSSTMDGRQKVAYPHIAGTVKKQAVGKEYRDNSTSQPMFQIKPRKCPRILAHSKILHQMDCLILQEGNYVEEQEPAIAMQKMYKDHDSWRRVSTNNERVFLNTRQIQEWLDIGHNLLESCKNNVQKLVESDQNRADFEEQYRYLQERIRGVLDQPLWWYSQEEQKVRQFWQELSPQLTKEKDQLHQDTAKWVQARNQALPPQDLRALDYSWQLQEYQRRSEEWLDQGSNLIERHNELKQYCEPESQKREDPKSRYAILCSEIRSLQLVCDSERKKLKKLLRPPEDIPTENGQGSRQVERTNPQRREKKRAPYKRRKTAEKEAVENSIRDQLVEDGIPFVKELETDFAWLDNNPQTLPTHDNNEGYYEELKDYLRRIEKRIQKLKHYQEAFDQQFRIYRPRDAERARRDLAYKKRKIAEKKSGLKYFPIEDHALHIQKLDQQLRDRIESQLQAMNYAVGLLKEEERNRSEQDFHKAPYPETAPEFAGPFHQGTPSKIPVEELKHPLSHAMESSKMPAPLAAQSGQHARDPIQLGSEFNASNRSSSTGRSIPAIEIPAKRKRGRPSGSKSSQRTSLSSMPPILPSPSRPQVQSCPSCNFTYSKLIPACPHHAPTTKIRLMLDNLKGIKDDPQQVTSANRLLKEALASKSAAQTSLRK
ncbi:Chromatin remodeling factor mit1 [Botrytis cinerea]